MKLMPDASMQWVASEIDAWFFTDAARVCARGELVRSPDTLAARPVR